MAVLSSYNDLSLAVSEIFISLQAPMPEEAAP